jgi:hypothetical protein
MEKPKPQAYQTLFYNQTSGEPNWTRCRNDLRDICRLRNARAFSELLWRRSSLHYKKIWGIEAKPFYDMADEMLKQREINAPTKLSDNAERIC